MVARVKRLRTADPGRHGGGQGHARGTRAALARSGGALLRPADFALSARTTSRPEKNLPERVIETVERLEEDFIDRSHKYEPFHAVVEVGEAIPVGPERDRDAAGDPIMAEVRRQLQSMMDGLAAERTPV